jgi:hypothetical protein
LSLTKRRCLTFSSECAISISNQCCNLHPMPYALSLRSDYSLIRKCCSCCHLLCSTFYALLTTSSFPHALFLQTSRLLQASPTSEQFPNGSSINTSLRGSSYFSLSLFRSHPPVRDDDLNRSLPPPLQRGKHHNRLILQISIMFAFISIQTAKPRDMLLRTHHCWLNVKPCASL